MSYIEEERFLDTLVVDSEGYICGRVASFEIRPDKVMLKLYKEVEEEQSVVDVERLREELMLALFGKAGPKLEKKLYNRIRKELRLPSKSPIGEAELVSFARMLGLDIPVKTVKTKRREDVEEPIDLDMVDCMSETPLGKCIILKEPVEAERKGVEILDYVPYKSTAEIRGMMVIDSEAKIIGHAERILIGKPLGLRIAVETVKETEVVDMEALWQTIMAHFKKPEKFYERLCKDLGIRPEEITEQHIIEWAERVGMPIPKRTETAVVKEMTLDIPWTVIKKIGEVILLNRTLEELRMRSMPILAPERREAASTPSEPKPLDLS